MKHKKLNMFIILAITAFMLWYLLKDNYQEIMGVVGNANYLWILLALIMLSLNLFFDCLSFKTITDMYTNKISLKFQLYLGIINKFFSGITPLATGGQPMQVYEMHKKGVSLPTGTNIAIQSYMIFQVGLIIMATIAIILNKALNLFQKVPILAELTAIGFIINFGILIILLCISFSKSFNKTIVKFIINILNKLKVIKNKEKTLEKWNNICEEYYKNAHILLNHKTVFIKCVCYQLIALSLYYSIPFVLAKALGITSSLTWYTSIPAAAYVFIMGCYIPIPGATGGMEFAFQGFFGNFIKGYPLNALLVMWRFLTYYIPVVIGAIIFNVHQGKETHKERKK